MKNENLKYAFYIKTKFDLNVTQSHYQNFHS